MKPQSELSRVLYQMLQGRGYEERFCRLISGEMNTDYTAGRMIGYLSHYQDLPAEEIVDEMLAILSDRAAWQQKKELEYNQSRINEMYRFGLNVRDEE